MRIVIISRCIYPMLAPRPHRATELAKYFSQKGHDVLLYGVLGKYDYSSFEQETGVQVCNLGRMLFATLDSNGERRNTVIDKLARKLFHRILEFPDIELAFKVHNILRSLKNIDMLITVAVPYPLHWGAAWAKKQMGNSFPKVWISDCGDPYMGDSVNSHPFYFHAIENFWGRETDFITIPVAAAMKAYSTKVQNKIKVIPQGFDFSKVIIDYKFSGNPYPRFAYVGAIYPGYRDLTKLLQYLSTLDDGKFELVVYTQQKSYYEPYKEQLGEKLQIKGYVPREQLVYELSQMDFLINLKNKSSVQVPSKLIDYYLSSRPIVDITTDFTEKDVFNEFFNGDYSQEHIKGDISQYDINNVGDSFLKLANKRKSNGAE